MSSLEFAQDKPGDRTIIISVSYRNKGFVRLIIQSVLTETCETANENELTWAKSYFNSLTYYLYKNTVG